MHHRGDGSFTIDGGTLDLRDRMVKWRHLPWPRRYQPTNLCVATINSRKETIHVSLSRRRS